MPFNANVATQDIAAQAANISALINTNRQQWQALIAQRDALIKQIAALDEQLSLDQAVLEHLLAARDDMAAVA